MSCVDSVERILEEYKRSLGLDGEVKVKVRNYRTRVAFADLKTKTIYINKRLLDLGERALRYLILHELLHIKLNSKYHSKEFHKLLYGHIPLEEVTAIRRAINEKLMALNHAGELSG